MMTILKIQPETTDIDVAISAENVEQFIAQYSPDFVAGYAQAVKDIFNGLEENLFKQLANNTHEILPQGRIARNMLAFRNHKRLLLNEFEAREKNHLNSLDIAKVE